MNTLVSSKLEANKCRGGRLRQDSKRDITEKRNKFKFSYSRRSKKNANGAGPPNLHNATRKFKKMWGKDGKSKNFDRQAVIFYDDSMEAIT